MQLRLNHKRWTNLIVMTLHKKLFNLIQFVPRIALLNLKDLVTRILPSNLKLCLTRRCAINLTPQLTRTSSINLKRTLPRIRPFNLTLSSTLKGLVPPFRSKHYAPVICFCQELFSSSTKKSRPRCHRTHCKIGGFGLPPSLPTE